MERQDARSSRTRFGMLLPCLALNRTRGRHSDGISCTNNFAFVRDFNKEVRHIASGSANCRIAGADNSYSLEQPHVTVYLQTEIGDGLSGDGFESLDRAALNVVGQLQLGLAFPAGNDALEIKRGKLTLHFVGERKVELRRL